MPTARLRVCGLARHSTGVCQVDLVVPLSSTTVVESLIGVIHERFQIAGLLSVKHEVMPTRTHQNVRSIILTLSVVILHGLFVFIVQLCLLGNFVLVFGNSFDRGDSNVAIHSRSGDSISW